jgi:hypothetical protein
LNSFILVELSCEVIAVNNSKYSCIDIYVYTNIQVLIKVRLTLYTPVIILSLSFRNFMSFEENSLRDSRILLSLFSYIDCVIIKMVIEDALSYSKILLTTLMNWFLEISIKFQNLNSFHNLLLLYRI